VTWIAPARLALVVLAAGLVAGCGQIVNPPGGHPTPAATSPSATRPSPTPSAPPLLATPRWVPAGQVPGLALSQLSDLRPPCRVQLEMYELGNWALVQGLIEAHQRGCQEQVMLDATESQSASSATQLTKAGVAVEMAHIANDGLDHVKALVLNGGAEALIGGVNWGSGSADTGDADVLLPGDPAASARLTEDWGNTSSSWVPGPTSSGALEGPSISQAMLSAIGAPQSKVLVLTNYLTAYAVQDALAAAVSRGVTVDVLLNPEGYGAKSAASWLTGHGVHVRYAPDSPYLHAKVILTPAEGIVGSANLTEDGASVNRELDVLIPTGLLPEAWAWGTALWATGTTVS
jgi:phosphatidylserine/phosphatidylglycerophosphate/cardiolipin synthase-like enzyme